MMKRPEPKDTLKNPPVFRTFFAILSVFINVIFPAGLSLAAAAPSDPLKGDYIICPATGGLMPATPAQKAPANSDQDKLHCPFCRPPAPTAIQMPLPSTDWVLVRLAVPIRYAVTQAAGHSLHRSSVFEARAPPA